MYLENVKAYKADYSDWKQDTASLKDIDIVSLKLNMCVDNMRFMEVNILQECDLYRSLRLLFWTLVRSASYFATMNTNCGGYFVN